MKKSVIVNGFKKSGIVPCGSAADDSADESAGSDTDTSGDNTAVLEEILRLFISDTDDSEFSGYSDGERCD